LIDACRETGTAMVAFSPLGRGFLAGAINDPARLEEGDMRRNMPRFSTENYPHNVALFERLATLAQALSVTPGQLALAWLQAKGSDIIPIPGTRTPAHMRENLAAQTLRLDDITLTQLDAMMTPDQVAGARYGEAQQADIDTEEFTA
ncbi:MAG: aldo/keto reductase, partial [Halomonas sp.]